MIDVNIRDALLAQVDMLPVMQQRQVLDFAAGLVKASSTAPDDKDFLAIVGTLPPEDAEEMLKAIEEGCEKVDLDGW
jgi:hypothetical protein